MVKLLKSDPAKGGQEQNASLKFFNITTGHCSKTSVLTLFGVDTKRVSISLGIPNGHHMYSNVLYHNYLLLWLTYQSENNLGVNTREITYQKVTQVQCEWGLKNTGLWPHPLPGMMFSAVSRPKMTWLLSLH